MYPPDTLPTTLTLDASLITILDNDEIGCTDCTQLALWSDAAGDWALLASGDVLADPDLWPALDDPEPDPAGDGNLWLRHLDSGAVRMLDATCPPDVIFWAQLEPRCLVRVVRARLDCQGQQLAQLLGVEANTVYRWEAGVHAPAEPYRRQLLALRPPDRVLYLADAETFRDKLACDDDAAEAYAAAAIAAALAAAYRPEHTRFSEWHGGAIDTRPAGVHGYRAVGPLAVVVRDLHADLPAWHAAGLAAANLPF